MHLTAGIEWTVRRILMGSLFGENDLNLAKKALQGRERREICETDICYRRYYYAYTGRRI